MSADSCAGCAFFREGTCRRYAPRPWRLEPNSEPWAEWPSVNPKAWCGEFKPAPRKPGARPSLPDSTLKLADIPGAST